MKPMSETQQNEDARVVLITGAGAGIGLAAARRFAAAGDRVVATVRNLGRAGVLREAMAQAPQGCEVVELDVTSDTAASVVEGLAARHGRIDVLVSNAGRSIEGALEDLSMEDLQESLDVNFLGAARVTRAVLPLMRAAGGGRILAVSSIGGLRATPFSDGYCAAKFALEGLFESLAPVVANFGIRVTLVEPGPVTGEFLSNSSAVARGPSEPYVRMTETFNAMRSLAYQSAPSPEDVAEVIYAATLEDDPPLRVQDTDGTSRAIGAKMKDLDGRRVLSIGMKMLE
jgi:NAD(P)-dependent dehydrogenase (short-subunit alcohol dehydrogenase family)